MSESGWIVWVLLALVAGVVVFAVLMAPEVEDRRHEDIEIVEPLRP